MNLVKYTAALIILAILTYTVSVMFFGPWAVPFTVAIVLFGSLVIIEKTN
jgi:hypothetical protein